MFLHPPFSGDPGPSACARDLQGYPTASKVLSESQAPSYLYGSLALGVSLQPNVQRVAIHGSWPLPVQAVGISQWSTPEFHRPKGPGPSVQLGCPAVGPSELDQLVRTTIWTIRKGGTSGPCGMVPPQMEVSADLRHGSNKNNTEVTVKSHWKRSP